ncbi:MAG: secretin N-terminal domain-containing protein [Acidobacteriota bacterium]
MSAALGVVVVLLSLSAVTAAEAQPKRGSGPIKAFAYTLKHQPADQALALVRPLLTARGTVEVQPGSNTLVIRENPLVIQRVRQLLAQFDRPPQDLRFDIQIVRAGPKRQGISPPQPESEEVESELSEALAARLREVLRYDDYRVLAEAGVTSREGEEVTYSLGQSYSVSFRPGTVMAGQRVKLEGFRILKQLQNPAKGRRLEPEELFHATLNLWLDRPFNVVIAQDESRQEALMVAISCRREEGETP